MLLNSTDSDWFSMYERAMDGMMKHLLKYNGSASPFLHWKLSFNLFFSLETKFFTHLYTGNQVFIFESCAALPLLISSQQLAYLGQIKNKLLVHEMDHLVCFVPAMLAVGAQYFPPQKAEKHQRHMTYTRVCL